MNEQTNTQLKAGDKKYFGFSEVEIIAVFENPYAQATQVLALDHTNKRPVFGLVADFTDAPEAHLLVRYDFATDLTTARGKEINMNESTIAAFKLTKDGDNIKFTQTDSKPMPKFEEPTEEVA